MAKQVSSVKDVEENMTILLPTSEVHTNSAMSLRSATVAPAPGCRFLGDALLRHLQVPKERRLASKTEEVGVWNPFLHRGPVVTCSKYPGQRRPGLRCSEGRELASQLSP